MESLNNILVWIEEADAENILAEKDLTTTFNELLKHELIDIEDGKVTLTEKGRKAKENGIEGVIFQEGIDNGEFGIAAKIPSAVSPNTITMVDPDVNQKRDFQASFLTPLTGILFKLKCLLLPFIFLSLLVFYFLS